MDLVSKGDVWSVGFDTISQKLLSDDSKSNDKISNMYTQLRKLNRIREFLAIMQGRHTATGKLNGSDMLEAIGSVIAKKMQFLDKLKVESGCSGIYHIIMSICKMMEDILLEGSASSTFAG